MSYCPLLIKKKSHNFYDLMSLNQVILIRTSALGIISLGSHITYYSLMFFFASTFKDKFMCLQDK